MATANWPSRKVRAALASRLAYHLRCLREDATNPDITSMEMLALVRDRARRIREIRLALENFAGEEGSRVR